MATLLVIVLWGQYLIAPIYSASGLLADDRAAYPSKPYWIILAIWLACSAALAVYFLSGWWYSEGGGLDVKQELAFFAAFACMLIPSITVFVLHPAGKAQKT